MSRRYPRAWVGGGGRHGVPRDAYVEVGVVEIQSQSRTSRTVACDGDVVGLHEGHVLLWVVVA